MIVETHVTMADLLAFNAYHMRTSPVIQRQLLVGRCMLTGLALLLGIGIIFAGSGTVDVSDLIFILLICVISFAIYPYLIRRSSMKTIEKLALEGKNKGMLGDQKLELASEALVVTTQSSTSTMNWSAVERIATTDDHAFLYVSAISALMVPRNAFDSQSEFQAFVAQAEAYRSAHTS